MNKFNEQKQIEETIEFKDSEVMNELNKEQQFTSMAQQRRTERLKSETIQVGDKVKWLFAQSRTLNQNCFGHVVSTDEKVMGNPCFLIRECEGNRETKVSKDKVSKAS